MKKQIFFAFATALIVFASCQKQESPEPATDNSPIFRGVISGTKTTLDITTGKVSWELTDTLSITDGTTTAIYYVSDIEESGNAVLKKKPGQPDLKQPGEGVVYNATYGAAPLTEQVYGTEVKNLPMSAVSETLTFQFQISCAVITLNIKSERDLIKSVAVRGVIDGNPAQEVTYTITCDEPLDVKEGKLFNIIVPAGNYDRFTFTNGTNCITTRSTKVGKTIALLPSTRQPINFTKLDFTIISGLFSVSESKQVRFTRGNLYWDGTAYMFEDDQLSRPTKWDENHVGHFFWTSDATNAHEIAYNKAANDSTKLFCEESTPLEVEGIKGYTLTYEEWNYLLGDKGMKGKYRANCENLRRGGVTVDGIQYCMIVAPDDYDKELKSKYTLEEISQEGLLCLPPTATRSDKYGEITAQDATKGAYITSTKGLTGGELRFTSFYASSNRYPTYTDQCRFDSGRAIRLAVDPEDPTLGDATGGTLPYTSTEVDETWFK